MPENAATMHNVIIEDRKKISMTGITDVGSFDEETLNIQSQNGEGFINDRLISSRFG